MRKSALAMVAAALLGLGVVGVGAARVGGYLSHSAGRAPAASLTTSQPSSGASLTSPSGPSGDGAGQGGD